MDETLESQMNAMTSADTEFLDPATQYTMPTFTCNVLDAIVAFTLHVRNVDEQSLHVTHTNDGQRPTVQIKFTSIGSGCYPIPYALAIQLADDTAQVITAEAEVWDNNVILQIELSPMTARTYYAGCRLAELNRFEFAIDERDVSMRKDSLTAASESLDVDVRVVSEKEVKIKITKKQPEDADEPLHSDDSKEKAKKKKRKNKKVRSFSESHCDVLREATATCTEMLQVKTTNQADLKHSTVVGAVSASIDINVDDGAGEKTAVAMKWPTSSSSKSRSLSESSNDDQTVPKHREIKGILKRQSSFHRSISESSNDDHIAPYTIDFGVGSIPEEGGTEMSESYKKHVRFDNNIQKQLFR